MVRNGSDGFGPQNQTGQTSQTGPTSEREFWPCFFNVKRHNDSEIPVNIGARSEPRRFMTYEPLTQNREHGGAFASITPATPGAGRAWDTTSLAVNGTLKVVSAASPPHFNSPVLSGSTLTLSGGGGTPNTDYILLASTNVALSVPNWDRVTTNQFDSGGNFSVSISVTPSVPQRFFLIQLP